MLNSLFSNRFFLGTLVVCVFIFAVGSYIWRQRIQREAQESEEATQQVLQQLEKAKAGSVNTPHSKEELRQSEETEVVRLKKVNGDSTEDSLEPSAKQVNDVEVLSLLGEEDSLTIENKILTERVSRFGFGPYPEVPLDFPLPNIWDHVEDLYVDDPEWAKNTELLTRVRIKLWDEGSRTLGVQLSPTSGLVYPIYPNTAYVRWADEVLEDGTVDRIATNVLGGPDVAQYAPDLHEGIIPPGITIIEMPEGGIDPYQFLNLHMNKTQHIAGFFLEF